MSEVPDAIDLAMSGPAEACAVRAGGAVICWKTSAAPRPGGRHHRRRPGRGPPAPRCDALSPTACAVRAGGTVACWSDGAVVPVEGLSGVVQLSGGVLGSYVYARTSDGRVLRLAWAGADMLAVTATPLDIDDAVDVAGGSKSVCALHPDGHVACWDDAGSPISFPPPEV